jgi:hypothetical protein
VKYTYRAAKAEHKNWADDAMRQPESGAFIRDQGSWIS